MAETVRWRRLVLESAAVVGSILLAFAIDAAWDLRQELAEERELLLGLRQELAENQSIIEQSRAETQEALGLLQDFLAGPPDESTTEPSAEAWGQIYRPMIRDWTGSFTTGFVDAATSSGRLALIQNPEVAASIARFRRALEDVDHMAERLGLISVRASEVLGRFRPVDAAFTASPNPWGIDPRMARTFFQDREVTGLVSARVVYYMGYLFVLQALEARIGEALELVDAELGD